MGWVEKLSSKHLRASMQLMLEFCHQQTSPGTPSVAYDAQHYAQMPSHNLLSQSMLLHDCSMIAP